MTAIMTTAAAIAMSNVSVEGLPGPSTMGDGVGDAEVGDVVGEVSGEVVGEAVGKVVGEVVGSGAAADMPTVVVAYDGP